VITCFIRYDIDPHAHDAFAAYARMWATAIPEAGADLFGYFGPREGSGRTRPIARGSRRARPGARRSTSRAGSVSSGARTVSS
jgi:hypothetical protein